MAKEEKVPLTENGSTAGNLNLPHPEYYSKIELKWDEPTRLDFVLAEPQQAIPPEFSAMIAKIEEVERLVRVLFQDDESRQKAFFIQLHQVADTGLRGKNCNPQRGLEDLQELKDSIADTFPAVREKIWRLNVRILLGVLAICGMASAVSYYFNGSWYPGPGDGKSIWPVIKISAFLIPLGAVIGLFVEFIFRVGDDMPYDRLREINPGRWKPTQRVLNTIVVAYILAALIGVGVFNVGFAGTDLSEFVQGKDAKPPRPELSLVIGFVTGFAFAFVRDLMQQFRPAKRDK